MMRSINNLGSRSATNESCLSDGAPIRTLTTKLAWAPPVGGDAPCVLWHVSAGRIAPRLHRQRTTDHPPLECPRTLPYVSLPFLILLCILSRWKPVNCAHHSSRWVLRVLPGNYHPEGGRGNPWTCSYFQTGGSQTPSRRVRGGGSKGCVRFGWVERRAERNPKLSEAGGHMKGGLQGQGSCLGRGWHHIGVFLTLMISPLWDDVTFQSHHRHT